MNLKEDTHTHIENIDDYRNYVTFFCLGFFCSINKQQQKKLCPNMKIMQIIERNKNEKEDDDDDGKNPN